MTQGIEYKDLIVNRPSVFLTKCAIWAAMIGIGWLLVDMQPWWAQFIGVTLVAMAFAHGIELAHQALHGTGTGNRRLDMKLGFVLGLPLLISIHHYQDRHLHHHQHVGTLDDTGVQMRLQVANRYYQMLTDVFVSAGSRLVEVAG
jgi:fatty acid desaturase